MFRQLLAIREKLAGWGERTYGSQTISLAQIVRLMWPLFLDQLFMRALSLLNTSMVSSYGPEAVSAVSVIESFNFFLSNIFIAIATGCTVVVAQFCGRGDRQSARETAAQAVSASVLAALIIAAGILLYLNPIIQGLFGEAVPLMHEYAKTFLIGSALSYPFFALIQTVVGAMRGSNNTKASLIFTTGLNVLNLLCNVLFLNIFRFGVFGLAVSILLSRVILAAPTLIYLLRTGEGLRLNYFFFPNLRLQRSIFYIAAPACLEQVFFHAGRILTQVFVVGYGTMSAAANAITLSFNALTQVGAATISIGIVTVVGQCVGAGDIKAAKHYIKVLTFTGIAVSSLMALFFIPILPFLLLLYNLPDEAYAIAFRMNILALAATPFTWPESFIVPAGLRAAGDVTYTSIVALICMWIVRVGFGYFLGTVRGYHLMGIWVATLLEWAVRALFFALRSKGDKWYRHKVI